MASRYQRFRRIVAPLALVAALAVLAQETCRGEDRAEVSFALTLGPAAADVRHVRVDLWADGASVGFFEAEASPGRPLGWRQPVPAGALEATIAITLHDGRVVELRRRIFASAGAQVTIDGDYTRAIQPPPITRSPS
jgi:hypothetical protein